MKAAIQKQTIMRVIGPLRSRVNRMAHEAGQTWEMQTRARLMAELDAMTATGASLDELNKHLDNSYAMICCLP